LLQATTPYAMDVSDPKREAEFCRPDCAAVLIDAGALVTPSVWDILIRCGAAGMMALLQQKQVLPRTLVVLAALGDQEGVRACLDEPEGRDRDAVNYAFMAACRFKRETVAAMLLERAIALHPGLGVEIDRWGGTAEGWAYNVGKDRGMAEWLATSERERGSGEHTDKKWPPE
jgi:hypothetical protein